jgi:uncharacterized membrane protein HdeD (DUF308 family)
MLDQMLGKWWLFALRGFAAIVFGILAIIWPGPAVEVLVLLFGAFALVNGLATVVLSATGLSGGQWAWFLVEGLAGMAAGVVTLLWPGITALVLLYLIAAWAIVTGILEIVAAIELRRVIPHEWLLILSGIASTLFGVLIAIFPGAGALSVIWLIGAYAVAFGVLSIAFGLEIRSLRNHAREAVGS